MTRRVTALSCEVSPLLIEKAIEPGAFRSNPDRAVLRGCNGKQNPVTPQIRWVQGFDIACPERDQAAAAQADPQCAFAVYLETTNPIVRKAIRTIEMKDSAPGKMR